MGILEKSILKGILFVGPLSPQNPGNEAADRIQNDQRSQFSTAQDIIPNGDFHIDLVGSYSLIHTLIASTHKDELIHLG